MRRTLPIILFLLLAIAGTLPAVPAQAATPAPVTVQDDRRADERSAVAAVDAFWRGEFARVGAGYRSPRVAGGYVGANGPACAGVPSEPGNAFYCFPGDFLAWDEQLMDAGYRQIGDSWVYLVIAHEWGHAIQARLTRSQVSVAAELQADCLAGAALAGAVRAGTLRIEPGDIEELGATLVAVADDFPWTDSASHGDARERTAAFDTGVQGGVPACV